MSDYQIIIVGAKATGMPSEKLIAKIGELLSAKRCRDTGTWLFSSEVMSAINSERKVSRHCAWRFRGGRLLRHHVVGHYF